MAEIINLRLARKARKRADHERQAEANRARSGQTRAQRDLHKREAERNARIVDGARREPEPE